MYKGRPTEAVIHLFNLSSNFNKVAHMHPTKSILPVVKANAYGHGAVEVVKHLIEDLEVTYVAVACLEEALELRKHYSSLYIIIMGPLFPEDLIVCSEKRFTATIHDMDMFDAVMLFKNQLKVHVKVDTGMHRLGIATDETLLVIDALMKNPKINLEGIYSHFASSHEDEAFTLKQISRFRHVIESLPTRPKMIHLSNTSAIFKYEHLLDFTTHVRLGLGLYGTMLDQSNNLAPVMELKSKIMQLKQLSKGEGVGYGQTYIAKEDCLIGVVPIGYADGFLRKNKGGKVVINNTLYPIVGIICMDMLFVKVDASVKKYDEVVLFYERVKVKEVASRLNTIPYEVLTGISARVKRTYIKEEK